MQKFLGQVIFDPMESKTEIPVVEFQKFLLYF